MAIDVTGATLHKHCIRFVRSHKFIRRCTHEYQIRRPLRVVPIERKQPQRPSRLGVSCAGYNGLLRYESHQDGR